MRMVVMCVLGHGRFPVEGMIIPFRGFDKCLVWLFQVASRFAGLGVQGFQFVLAGGDGFVQPGEPPLQAIDHYAEHDGHCHHHQNPQTGQLAGDAQPEHRSPATPAPASSQ